MTCASSDTGTTFRIEFQGRPNMKSHMHGDIDVEQCYQIITGPAIYSFIINVAQTLQSAAMTQIASTLAVWPCCAGAWQFVHRKGACSLSKEFRSHHCDKRVVLLRHPCRRSSTGITPGIRDGADASRILQCGGARAFCCAARGGRGGRRPRGPPGASGRRGPRAAAAPGAAPAPPCSAASPPSSPLRCCSHHTGSGSVT